ncbi:hypothetical protein [Sorangium sp. So ce854]|uniref:hypothetical protein n=1 Tax=Sorangium sp. So ce854 TaxID=3133322 RepID=UPI003F623C48
MDPAAGGATPWARLYQALVRRFPRCRGRAEGDTPPPTLGRVDDPARVQAGWAAQLGRRQAPVGKLVLLSRRGAEPMQARAWVALGSGAARWAVEAAAPLSTQARRRPSRPSRGDSSWARSPRWS